jgi:LDH2 family malate/lactate/ureidoglycolate dehydrogenase
MEDFARADDSARGSKEQLRHAVEQLSIDEIGTFAQEVLALRARRVAPALAVGEATLLERINGTLSSEQMARHRELVHRRDEGTLSPSEHASRVELSDAIEVLDADRVAARVEFARRHDMTLDVAMASRGTRSVQP